MLCSFLNTHDLSASLAIFICVIGIGALSMASSIAQSGLFYGAIAFGCVCIFNVYATILLSKVLYDAPIYVETYSDLGYYVGGLWGRRMVLLTQLSSCLLVPIALLVLGGSSLLPVIFADLWNPSNSIWIIIMAVSLLPFALIRNLKEAFWVMIVATLAALFSIFVSVGHTAAVISWDAFEETDVKTSNVLSVFGNFAFAFGAGLIVPTAQRSHPEPSRMPMNIVISMSIISFIYIAIAGVGYAQFGCAAPSNILLSMQPSIWRTAVFIAMQIYIMISFAVAVNPALYVIERFVLGEKDDELFSSTFAPINTFSSTEFSPENALPRLSKSSVSPLCDEPYDIISMKNSERFSVYSSRGGELAILSEVISPTKLSLMDKIKSILLRTSIVGLQTFLALLGQSSLPDIVSFIGATTHTISCVIIPCVFYYKKFHSDMSFFHRCFCALVVLINIGFGLYTAVIKMKLIIEVASEYKLFTSSSGSLPNRFEYCPVGYMQRH